MNSTVFRAPSRWMWGTLTMAAFLAGCGGGDDPIPAASLSGVAAVGAPIANGTIAVQCAGGSAMNTTTSTTGAWQVSFAGQTLPCAIQVSGGSIGGSTNTMPYHSIAVSLGTVNVTPLTDLIVAQLAGANPQTWFGSPVFTDINASAVETALNSVASGLGITSTLGSVNPITTTFKAEPGDAVDQLLEALKTALADTSQTYAALLSAAQTGSYSAFTGFGAAFSTAAQGGSTTPPPSGGSGSLTVEVSIAGAAATTVTINGVPAPANQGEFCDGLTQDSTFSGFTSSGGSMTINSCSFTNNVGQVSATLTTTVPVSLSLPYAIKYTYNP